MTAIAVGGSHACALTVSAALTCWGRNDVGQLATGTRTNATVPVRVDGLGAPIAAITASTAHTCAVTEAGALACWGWNEYGQLGNGSTTSAIKPVPVTGLDSGVRAVSGGGAHTCAVTTDGAVRCWGANPAGGLGDGTTTQRTTAVAVIGLSSGASSVSAGALHTCAVTTAGEARCWGLNDTGQLGDGSTARSSVPRPVSGLGQNVVAVDADLSHTCALTTTGAPPLCWGNNAFAQLGNGSTSNSTTPVPVGAAPKLPTTPISGLTALARGLQPHLRLNDPRCGEVLGIQPIRPTGRRDPA